MEGKREKGGGGGNLEILLVASCLGNQSNIRPKELQGSYTNWYFLNLYYYSPTFYAWTSGSDIVGDLILRWYIVLDRIAQRILALWLAIDAKVFIAKLRLESEAVRYSTVATTIATLFSIANYQI